MSGQRLLDSKEIDSEMLRYARSTIANAAIQMMGVQQSFVTSLPRDDATFQYIEEEDLGLPEHIVAAENLTETVKVCFILRRQMGPPSISICQHLWVFRSSSACPLVQLTRNPKFTANVFVWLDQLHAP